MLFLFDIDGTLVQRASREHAKAVHQAIRAVHGVDVDALAIQGNAAGRTDGEIARLYLLAAGVAPELIDARAAEVRDACCRLYTGLCPSDISANVVDGIPALLQSLAANDDHLLSLVTGNYEPVARVKLHAAGIGHFFREGQGGFGSDAEDRAQLPPIARRRAGRAAGLDQDYPREQTVVIGDTPRDIACARADGLRCVAVTTGPHPAEDLTGADHVARNARELADALAQLAAAPGA